MLTDIVNGLLWLKIFQKHFKLRLSVLLIWITWLIYLSWLIPATVTSEQCVQICTRYQRAILQTLLVLLLYYISKEHFFFFTGLCHPGQFSLAKTELIYTMTKNTTKSSFICSLYALFLQLQMLYTCPYRCRVYGPSQASFWFEQYIAAKHYHLFTISSNSSYSILTFSCTTGLCIPAHLINVTPGFISVTLVYGNIFC